jgi:hypothetical protein
MLCGNNTVVTAMWRYCFGDSTVVTLLWRHYCGDTTFLTHQATSSRLCHTQHYTDHACK